MTYCGHCGSPLEPGATRCATCGQPVVGGRTPRLSSRLDKPGVRLLVGNWVGAAQVAGAAVGTSLALSTLLVLLGYQSGMSVRDTLTAITAMTTGAFGADVGAHSSGITAHVGVFPLTVTFAAVAAAVLMFRRVTAPYPRAVDALVDAARAALIAAFAMMILALVFTTSADGDKIASSAAGAFFLTLLILALVLALAVLLRRDWLRSRIAQKVHDWVRAPVAGLVAILLLLPVAGIIAALALLLVGSGSTGYTSSFSGAEWRLLVAGVIGFAGNAGMWAITLGTSGKVGVFGLEGLDELFGSVTGDSVPSGGRLTWYTGHLHEPGLWVTVILTPLCLAVAAYVVVRASGFRGKGDPATPFVLRNLAVWVASLLVAVPWFVRLANVHLSIDASGYQISPGFGTFGLGATFLLFAYALVVGAVVSLLLGLLDGPAIAASIAAIGRQLQQRPDQPPPPPSGYAQPPRHAPPSYGPPSTPPPPPPPPPTSRPPSAPPPQQPR